MDNEVLFMERQGFKQWFLWITLLGLDGLLLFGVVKQVILGQPFGDKPGSNAELIIIAGLVLLLTLLFISFRLDTQIKKEGIYVRFYPFHFSFRYYPWDSISKAYVRKYSPVSEFGGWGIRFGAFNVSGNKGLQLIFTNNKKLLIGTNKPEELTETLTKIGRLKP